MKRNFKCLSVILTLVITIFSFSVITWAQTTEQDGLQVKLATNKANYTLKEDIKITISVTNTNDFTIENVSIEALLPDNFKLKDSSQKATTEEVDIPAGETITLSVIAFVEDETQSTVEPTTKVSETDTTATIATEMPMATQVETGNNIVPTIQAETSTQNNSSTTQAETTTQSSKSSVSNVQETTSNQTTTKTSKNSANTKKGKSPLTGVDYTILSIMFILFFLSLSILLYCLIAHMNKRKKIISLILCTVITITSIAGFTSYKTYAEEKVNTNDSIYEDYADNPENYATINIIEQIKIDNKKYEISANINYYDYWKTVDLMIDQIMKINNKFVITNNDTKTVKNAVNIIDEITEYLDILKNQGKIKDYQQSGGDITVDLLIGKYYYNFSMNVPNLQGGTSRSKLMSFVPQSTDIKSVLSDIDNTALPVLTVQPYASEMISTVFDDCATLIAHSNLGYSFTDDINDSFVTVDFMKNLSKYKVIIWDGHGVYNGSTGEFIGIALGEQKTEENAKKYEDDIDNNRLSWTADGKYVVTSEFFDYYYKNNSLNNSLIYLGCCDTANDDSTLPQTLINKGAEAVIAYKNSVYTDYNREMCQTIFNELVKQDGNAKLTQTVSQAVSIAKAKHGEKDSHYTSWYDEFLNYWNAEHDYISEEKRAELILTENDDKSFRLVDYSTVSGCIKEASDKTTPVEDVEVRVLDESENAIEKTKTDKNGNFTLSLTAGKYTLSIGGELNATSVYSYENYTEDITIESNIWTVLKDDILLTRITNGIAGNVFDSETKKPLTDVKVKAYKDNDGTTEYVSSSTTNENGEYTVNVEKNGIYNLEFIKDGYITGTQDGIISTGSLTYADYQYLVKDGTSGDTVFAGGDGTQENPYKVSTPEQLDAVRNDLTAHYIQINDIDMSDWGNWEPIGCVTSIWGGAIGGSNYEAPIINAEYFEGVYDGNNYSIIDLTIKNNDVSVTKDCFGLFAGLNKATIKNLTLNNISYNINKETTDYSSYWENQSCTFSLSVGGISGRCSSSSISNCSVSGKINVINCSDAYVGGIAGIGDEIVSCNSNVAMYIDANKDSRYEKDSTVSCGGIIGYSTGSKISNCTNFGNVNSTAGYYIVCGGISGQQYGEIEKSKNYANISGATTDGSYGFVGGIIGKTTANILSCINYGDIKCESNATKYATSPFGAKNIAYAGSIVGFSENKISNSFNLGSEIVGVGNTATGSNITSYSYVGRICGYSDVILDCYSINTTTLNGSIPTENITTDDINGQSLTKEEIEEKIKDLN